MPIRIPITLTFLPTEDFLADVLTTAMETPVGSHWITWTVQQRDSEHRPILAELEYENATDGHDTMQTTITLDRIAEGIKACIEKKLVNADLTGYITAGVQENDASHIDADAADVILQATVYGNVIFG